MQPSDGAVAMGGAGRTLLAVHAHPDDESLSTGGILARYSAEGVRTVLVVCTGGEVGEISDPTLARPENLAEVRRAELAEATRLLGVSRVIELGYRDSGMMGSPENAHPASFRQADLQEATGRLVAIMRQERPQVIVTYDPTGMYGHPDHVRANQVAAAAFAAAGQADRFPEAGPPWRPSKLYYWVLPRSRMERLAGALQAADTGGQNATELAEQLTRLSTPDELVTTDVDVSAYVEVKRAALAAHRTQAGGPHRLLLDLPVAVVRDLWARESFQLAAGPSDAPAGTREGDLFAGVAADSPAAR